MTKVVIEKDAAITFKDLIKGDVFISTDNRPYIKTENLVDPCDDVCNAVDLMNGTGVMFNQEDSVQLRMELIIK